MMLLDTLVAAIVVMHALRAVPICGQALGLVGLAPDVEGPAELEDVEEDRHREERREGYVYPSVVAVTGFGRA